MHEDDDDERIEENDTKRGYEQRDVSYAPYVRWVAGLFLFTGVAVLTSLIVFKVMVHLTPAPEPGSSAAVSQELPPQPRLQAHPALDLLLYKRAEDAQLNSYGWVNRQEGIVRIPVGLALDIIAKQGLPELPPSLRPQATEKDTYRYELTWHTH